MTGLNKNNIYLDHNATSILDGEVADLLVSLMHKPMNPSSLHEFGRSARLMVENARNSVLTSLGKKAVNDVYDLVFVSSGTEANNIVIDNFKEYTICVSACEHISVIETVSRKTQKFELIPIDHNGKVNEDEFEQILQSINEPIFVSIMLANNETGVIQDIKTLVELAKKYNAIFHCDISQAYGKIHVNILDLNCDFYTLSSHKCGGPQGVAGLIFKKNSKLSPMIFGGGQEKGLKSGTENTLAIVGFGAIANKIEAQINKYTESSTLRNFIESEIKNFAQKDCQIYGEASIRLPNTSCIRMANVDNQLQLIKFDMDGIALSAGSACASGKVKPSHVLLAMGASTTDASSTVRMSLGPNNTHLEAEKFISSWKNIFKTNRKKYD